jgi:hypothetical protein
MDFDDLIELATLNPIVLNPIVSLPIVLDPVAALQPRPDMPRQLTALIFILPSVHPARVKPTAPLKFELKIIRCLRHHFPPSGLKPDPQNETVA